MNKEESKKINKQLNGKTELQRAFDIYNADLKYYKQSLKNHYKNVEFCEKSIAMAEYYIDKCLEKAKEYGIDLKTTS